MPQRKKPKSGSTDVRLLLQAANTLARTTDERLDRMEDAIERLAEETRAGLAALREENRRAAEENNRFKLLVRGAIESLAQSAAKHDKAIAANAKAIASLEKHFQAYLVSRPQ